MAKKHGLAVVLVLAMTLAWFAPVIFGDKVFVSDNTMPAFFMPVQLWSDLLYSGFPVFADPTFANAYPVRIVLSATADLLGKALAFNLYVWSAYAIAGLGTYAYVVEITGERLAGAIGAGAFAFCGFLQAHLGHETITHTAAWLPAIAWATHRVMVGQDNRDMAWLSLFVALAYLGNHPQITFQIGVVSVLYALALLRDAPRRVPALVRFGLAWLLGMVLVIWSIVPSWENGSLSMRGLPPTTPNLDGAVPLDQVIQFAMPWLFGGSPPSSVAPVAAFGDKMFVEIINYVAAPVLILAFVALLSSSKRVIRFWGAIAVVFFVLSLGPQTLLGEVRFFTPVFNLFNNPARDILAAHFALAVLAAAGAAMLLRGEVARGRLHFALALGLLPTLAALLLYPMVARKAASAGITLPQAWGNVAVWMPILVAAVAMVTAVLAHRIRGAAAGTLLLAMVVAGCGYFGWFAPWRLYSGPAAAALDEPPAVTALRQLRRDKGGRVIAAEGWVGPAGVSPNGSMMFGLPNIAGYGPLLPRRYAEVLRLTNSGWMKPDMFLDSNVGLDLAGARWVFPHAPAPADAKALGAHGIWAAGLIDRYIGGSCMNKPLDQTLAFRLPIPMQVSHVALVTTLGCGTEVLQDMEVARVVLSRDGTPGTQAPLLAGRDTAEWSIECVTQKIAGTHVIAKPFDSTPAPGGGPGCIGHSYLADLPIGGAASTSIRIEWTGKAFPRAMLYVKHATVFDAAGKAYPLGVDNLLFADESRWKRHEIAKGVTVLENLRALPSAWVVHELAPIMSEDAELEAIYGGRLANGGRFDPRSLVISSDPQAASLASASATDRARAADLVDVEVWDGATKAFSVNAAAPGVLVVSNRFYPGWTARVDGEERPVVRVDGVLQGIPVAQGIHRVTLDFRPTYFPILLAVGTLAVVLVGWLFLRRRLPGMTAGEGRDA